MMWFVVFIGSAVAMEPISAQVHRGIGHGFGWRVHRSHHEGDVSGFEANDLIPTVSAVVTIGMFLLGSNVAWLGSLTPIAAGFTLYGLAYTVAHDPYIHR